MILVSCNSIDDVSIDIKGVDDFNDNVIKNPYIVISREDLPLVKATSKILIKNEESNAILRGSVRADFFNDEGDYTSQLVSDSAHIDNKTNNLHAYGNVRVVSEDSVKLFSNSILWDNHYKLITSHDSVMFTTSNNDTMHGVGFESDMDLTEWKIKKPRGSKGNKK